MNLYNQRFSDGGVRRGEHLKKKKMGNGGGKSVHSKIDFICINHDSNRRMNWKQMATARQGT